MANLIDTGAAWPAGIYQIEETDPVLGGVPNVATGAGMTNIPHLQLAQRTQSLKDTVDNAGLGATASPLVTLNAARANGTYSFASSDPATPATGVWGTVVVAAGPASSVTQMAFQGASNRAWHRSFNGTTWSAWKLIWAAASPSEVLADTGWSRLPSGQLEQWGSGVTDANGRAAITFMTAFATDKYIPGGIHHGAGHAFVIEDASFPKTTTRMTLRLWDGNTTFQAGWTVRWRAIGW